jgi:alanine racemase
MSRPTKLHIDTQALQHNLERVRNLAPLSKIMAMVKDNAYGHGLVIAAQALHNADSFGVLCIDEAITLRRAGVRKPIVLMQGFFSTNELETIAEYNFECVIHNAVQLQALETYKLSKPITVWLKINTGMYRLGFSVQEINNVWGRLTKCASVECSPRLMTHFAAADNLHKESALAQIKLFNDVTKDLDAPRSLANSAAILSLPESYADWVRPGLVLYGISPFTHMTGKDYNLKPAMELSSTLIAIHKCCKGDKVVYGGTWICPENMKIGVVAIGYADGYPRCASGGWVLINGNRASLIGRVSSDLLTVDLREVPKAKIGDHVILWGNNLPVETVANFADTIPDLLLCGVGQRQKY